MILSLVLAFSLLSVSGAWEWPWKSAEEVLSEAVRANDETSLERLDAMWTWATVDLDRQDEDKAFMTAMAVAAWNQNYEVTRWLLRHGASPNALCKNGWSPLHVAANRGNQRVIRLLLGAGALIDQRTGSSKLTPLMFASSSNQPGAVRLLLQHGAAKFLRNKEQKTALDMARDAKLPDCIFELTRKAGELGPDNDEDDGGEPLLPGSTSEHNSSHEGQNSKADEL